MYKSNLNNVIDTFKQNVNNAMKEAGKEGVKNIKKETPVITGNLRDKNKYKLPEYNEIVFYNDEDYSGYVNFGTWKQNANPFFQRGINNSLTAFKKIIYNNMKI